MDTKYIPKNNLKPGTLIKVRSYHTNDLIPAVVIKMETTGTGAEYIRAVDSEGESFLCNPDYLEYF